MQFRKQKQMPKKKKKTFLMCFTSSVDVCLSLQLSPTYNTSSKFQQTISVACNYARATVHTRTDMQQLDLVSLAPCVHLLCQGPSMLLHPEEQGRALPAKEDV